MKNNIAVYAGTFDPITLGHIDMIERAAHMFDKLFIAVAINKQKNPLFNLDERVALSRQVLSHCNNVHVKGFDTLLLEFAKQHDAHIILRGLRTASDFDYELQLANMNKQLDKHIETIFLMPAENYRYISSSLVREIASLGGEVTAFVSPIVAQALQKKFAVK